MPSDSDPSKWDCPPHTKAKHDMLASYLDGWFPTLSKWNGRVLYFDGFAGRGRYNDGSEGSPLVALRWLVEHRSFPQMRHREFVFYLVEADSDNAASLEREINAFKAEKAPWPATVKTYVVNEKFDVTANAILDQLREQKRRLAPTFAFIDPFGYSGIPMQVISERWQVSKATASRWLRRARELGYLDPYQARRPRRLEPDPQADHEDLARRLEADIFRKILASLAAKAEGPLRERAQALMDAIHEAHGGQPLHPFTAHLDHGRAG